MKLPLQQRMWVIGGALLAMAIAMRSTHAADDVLSEIRAAAEQVVKRFDAGQAKELAAAFTDDGEFIDENGVLHQGQEELQTLFSKFFEKYPGAKLTVEIESVRAVGPNLAIEEGTRTITDKGDASSQTRYVTILNKADGQWRIASTRDFASDVLTPQDRLQGLAWLVGDWVNEGSDAVVKISYRWSEDKNYLLGDYSIVVDGNSIMKSTQRIGWNPVTQRVQSWLFDSDGGFSEGQWTASEDGWMVKSNSVIADGRTGSATLRYLPQGEDRFLLSGVDRIVGDEVAEDFEVAVARKPASPAASEEQTSTIDKPAEKDSAAATTKPAPGAPPKATTPATAKPAPAAPRKATTPVNKEN